MKQVNGNHFGFDGMKNHRTSTIFSEYPEIFYFMIGIWIMMLILI